MRLLYITLALMVCALTLADTPYKYLYVPGYGNRSSDGSINARFYGLIYKDKEEDNTILSNFITSGDVKLLRANASTPGEKERLELNLDPFLHWDLQTFEKITFDVKNGNSVTMNDRTGVDGQFDEFHNVPATALQNGAYINYTAAKPEDSRHLYANITIYSATGYSIISDLDDVLRDSRIWNIPYLVRDTILLPLEPVRGMPELYANWSRNIPNVAFNYATTTPILLADEYLRWLYTVYPYGSLDFRPFNIFDFDDIINVRADQVKRLGETFPQRKFVMMGDTSSRDTTTAFPDFARKHPEQTVCIFIRNITATFPDYSNYQINLEKAFAGVPRNKWFVWDRAEDLYLIDVTSGNCHPPGYSYNQTTASGGYGGTATSSSGVVTFSTLLIVTCLALYFL
ncbi:hypothetical protein AKO1_011317 [Acrasis kona]|uniref:Phosphatidate phosphatase APP1 catalytic domain-containing protein n=1 Tax=Acrasis kona TaxID=1008807 RepID=A0AAW2YXY2_9EUKA